MRRIDAVHAFAERPTGRLFISSRYLPVMRSAVRRAVGLVAEALAFFTITLLAVWAVRKLRNTAFLLAIPLAFARPSACNIRRAASG